MKRIVRFKTDSGKWVAFEVKPALIWLSWKRYANIFNHQIRIKMSKKVIYTKL